ncbi:MAG: hypothetical protein DRQ65_08280 [Gammaproteobacteria bacterium]|nr:MAG: hypothetical protein DRQ65_08280 [Gammaproteobacteria bacterium]
MSNVVREKSDLVFQPCRICDGTGRYAVPNPKDGGATAIEEQCQLCWHGYVDVEIGRLTQHAPYLAHLINNLPSCEEAGCDLIEDAHEEICVIADLLVDLKFFLATVAANNGECPHDPMTMLGKPIGQYHCPECGGMVVAGMPHL